MGLSIVIDRSKFGPAIAAKLDRFKENADKAIYSGVVAARGDLEQATAKFTTPIETNIDKRRLGSYDLISPDPRYLWLNRGTKRHDIRAHTDRGMTFPWANSRQRGEHLAKTSRSLWPGPGNGDSYRSGASRVGGLMIVDHPGIKARNWSGILRRKYSKEIPARVIRALRNAR